ncbi:TIGR01906 family membrane protein [Dubosiella newyorkensis]|uniref:TIGR01906 family membrane protein n=1 Tax=Dubosiella newyorkensis TaxID=1862672 RepID=UPI00248C871D|nr:TIGR01906 family membrane protein [Dubosiella newyorkensis]
MNQVMRLLFGWSLILTILFSSVRIVAFDASFYAQFYEKTKLADELGVSNQDLNKSMAMMLDYITGKRSNMDGTMVRDGHVVQIYNAKEKAHMKDVRQLYQNVMLALKICVGILIAVPCLFYIRERTMKKVIANCCVGFFQSLLCFGVFLLVIGFWALTDFTDFWIKFHELFFTNDLWLLDPRTDFMIEICPEALFSSLILRIVVVMLAGFVPCALFSIWYMKRKAPIGYSL